MSTLAHVFEAEGLATIALGSQRNQIENTAPPRGLWCDFPLGRPLGKPADPAFQHRVLAHAFRLLAATEPVFETFAERIAAGCLVDPMIVAVRVRLEKLERGPRRGVEIIRPATKAAAREFGRG